MSWILVAAFSGLLAVIAGAFGAHGLAVRVSAQQLASWSTANDYHLLHSVVVLGLGLYAVATDRSVTPPAALFTAGIVLFSGSIYGLVLTSWSWLGPLTPLGGLCLMIAWLSLIWLVRPS